MTIGIANAACVYCEGMGLVLDRDDQESPCECALRAVFNSCLYAFKECVALGERTASVSWEPCYGPTGGRVFSRKREEYLADFLLVTERSLTEEDYRIFRYHFLLGADSQICCQKLNMDRGIFFHLIYRMKQRLGRVYAELQPYPLYPLRDYFGGCVRKDASLVRVPGIRVRAPLPLSA